MQPRGRSSTSKWTFAAVPPTYGRWAGVTLSDTNHRMLYVPVGFAHGFCVLRDTARVVYKKMAAEYEPALDRGIIWNDPEGGIRWPVEAPMLSPKDACLSRLRDADNNFECTAAAR